MSDLLFDNFFIFLALAFIAAIFAPYFSLFLYFLQVIDMTSETQGGFLRSAANLLGTFFKFVVSVTVGGIALFAWNLGITANDIWFGLPLHKQICHVVWPTDLTGKTRIYF